MSTTTMSTTTISTTTMSTMPAETVTPQSAVDVTTTIDPLDTRPPTILTTNDEKSQLNDDG